jgi:hypothetical protein
MLPLCSRQNRGFSSTKTGALCSYTTWCKATNTASHTIILIPLWEPKISHIYSSPVGWLYKQVVTCTKYTRNSGESKLAYNPVTNSLYLKMEHILHSCSFGKDNLVNCKLENEREALWAILWSRAKLLYLFVVKLHLHNLELETCRCNFPYKLNWLMKHQNQLLRYV